MLLTARSGSQSHIPCKTSKTSLTLQVGPYRWGKRWEWAWDWVGEKKEFEMRKALQTHAMPRLALSISFLPPCVPASSSCHLLPYQIAELLYNYSYLYMWREGSQLEVEIISSSTL